MYTCLCKELIKLYACTLQVGGGNWYTHVHGGEDYHVWLQFKLAVHRVMHARFFPSSKGGTHWYIWCSQDVLPRERPYHPERTGSHPNAEVKLGRAWLVLARGTSWEP